MIFEIRHRRLIMPHLLKEILGVWFWASVRPFVAGLVVFSIGFELGIQWVMIAGLCLCFPLLSFAYTAAGIIVMAILITPGMASFRLARKLLMGKRECPPKPALPPPSGQGVWDRDLDS